MSRRPSATTRIGGEVAGRRAVLAGLGVVGAEALAACSSGGSSASSTPADSTASPSATTPEPAPTSAPASTSAAPASTSAAPAPTTASAAPTESAAATSTAAVPAGFAVAEREIPVGGGEYYEREAVIITQPTAGNYKAFSSVCTHQGCPVTRIITGGLMVCPCHGSRFSITDGSVLRGPATEPLAAKKVTVFRGAVYVAPS